MAFWQLLEVVGGLVTEAVEFTVLAITLFEGPRGCLMQVLELLSCCSLSFCATPLALAMASYYGQRVLGLEHLWAHWPGCGVGGLPWAVYPSTWMWTAYGPHWAASAGGVLEPQWARSYVPVGPPDSIQLEPGALWSVLAARRACCKI